MAKDLMNKYDYIYSLSVHVIIIIVIALIASFVGGLLFTLHEYTILAALMILLVCVFIAYFSRKKRAHDKLISLSGTFMWGRVLGDPEAYETVGNVSKSEIKFLLIFALILVILFLVLVFVLLPSWV